MAFYATTQALRVRLATDGTDLSDGEAARLLTQASDAIDYELHSRTYDAVTGRRVVVADVAAWRWEKIAEAAVEYARVAFLQEQALKDTSASFDSIKGPDFSFSGRIAATNIAHADPLDAARVALRASGLIVGYQLGRATA